jgi:hypothetical protein
MLDKSSVEFSDNSNKRCKACDDLQILLLAAKLRVVFRVATGRKTKQ